MKLILPALPQALSHPAAARPTPPLAPTQAQAAAARKSRKASGGGATTALLAVVERASERVLNRQLGKQVATGVRKRTAEPQQGGDKKKKKKKQPKAADS